MDAHDYSTTTLARNGFVSRLRVLLSPDEPAPAAPVDSESTRFAEQLELELERAKRSGRLVSLLLCEVPGGGRPGEVRSTMEAGKRRIDGLARVGEDRFALILPETGEQGALRLAERLRMAIAASFEGDEGEQCISFGIATFPRHGRSPAAVTKAAARALEAVRLLGGNHALLESGEAPASMVSFSRGDGDADLRLETLLALAETVDIRDQGSAGHSRTVGRYAERIARELGFTVRAADRVRLGGLLHDVGKVGVPEAVLQKPEPLDEREWEIVRRHAEIGAKLIDDSTFEDVREWVLAHHERPDANGYPHGLKADAIPLEARIIAVADAYESMTTKHPYRAAFSHEAAQAELCECSGTQFDQRVVQAFLRVLEREGVCQRQRSATGR